MSETPLQDRQEVEKWLQHISTYERAFKKWEARVEKIIKKYRDDRGERATTARLNILWSNVQTLTAATFAKLPKADVSRRFRDNDPVGRVGSLILERALDYELEHYTDYRATLKACVLDRFLGGRGTAWARYEPTFKPAEVQVTDDVRKESDPKDEVIDYECAPIDYVHWKDFGHVLARTWEEVPAVWRKVYMTREALLERFPKDGDKVPLDAKPEEYKESGADKAELSRACVYEIWDKEASEALWLSKSLGTKLLDRKADPLQLEEFFPCPKPMYSTLANDKLEPTPDYALYQYQAEQLDTLSTRIEGLIDALKVMGVYDASITEIGRLFTEGENTAMFPVKNWGAYAEKGKLVGALDIVELKPIYEALAACYLAMDQIKNQIYEITRISDIMRGHVNPREKLGQSQMKTQYGNLGIKAYQDQVGEFATSLLRIKAQIMCNKFTPQTLLTMSAADELSEHDKKLVIPAMELLIGPRMKDPESQTPNPLRAFRVEIAADSMIHLDEKEEQDGRMQFIAANSTFMKEAIGTLAAVGPAGPALVPLMMEMWKFAVTAFKVGKSIEGAFDEATEKLKGIAAQPQPQIPPEMIKQIEEKAQMQADTKVAQQNASKEVAFGQKEVQHGQNVAKAETALSKREADLAIREAIFAANQQISAKADSVKKAEESAIKQETKAKADGAKADEARAMATGDAETIIKAVKQDVKAIEAVKEEITTLREEMDGDEIVLAEKVADDKGNMIAVRLTQKDGSKRDIQTRLH